MAHDAEKLSYWTDHYRRWQGSGISQRSYCRDAGISFSSFDHWRRRIRSLSGAASWVSDKAGLAGPDEGKLTLVPVQLGNSAGGSGDIRLRSPGGWEITLPSTLDGDLLRQVLLHLP